MLFGKSHLDYDKGAKNMKINSLITATILGIMVMVVVSYLNVAQARTPIIVHCDETNNVYTFHVATWKKLYQIEKRHIKNMKWDGFRLVIENNFGQRKEFRIRKNKSCSQMFGQRTLLKMRDIPDRIRGAKEFLR